MAANSFYSEDELKELGLKAWGENVLISKKASIYSPGSIRIGSHVRVDDFCILSGKITLENYIHISAGTFLYGGEAGILLEDFTAISSRCGIYAVSDDYSGMAMTNPMVPEKYRNVTQEPVVLKKYSIVGSGCTVLPGVVLKEGAAVGSMSLVNRSLAPWGIYAGIPCRKLRDRVRKLEEREHDFLLNLEG